MSPISTDLTTPLKPVLGPEGQKSIDLAAMTLLAGAADEAARQEQLEELQHFARSFASAGDTLHAGKAYLEARIALARKDALGVDLNFQPLCEKINQAEAWPVLARAASEWLAATQTHPAVRYLIRAWRNGGAAAVPAALLAQAHAAFPEDAEVCWALGHQMEEAGGSRESRRLLAQAAVLLAAEGDSTRVEELFARLLDAPEGSVHRQLIRAVEELAAHGKAAAAAPLFDSLLTGAALHGLAETAWLAARHILERHPKETAWRAPAVAAVRAARADVSTIDRVIEASGLARPAVAPAEALAQLDRVLNFAPGYYVEHLGWGLGPIKDNDGEFLVIDFPNKPKHRMNLKAAAGVLKSLPADDLKVQVSTALPKLKEMLSSDPVAIVVLALRRAGGEAAAADLRKILVPALLATGEWSAWWKKTKPLLTADARIDARQAFRESYRLPAPGEADDSFDLPAMDEQLGIDKNVDVLYGFAEHHPGSQPRLIEAFRERIQRWADRKSARLSERGRALRLLRQWDPANADKYEASIRGLFLEGLDLSAAGDVTEMHDILAIGVADPDTRDLALREGLNARSAPVRDRALEHLWAIPGHEPVDIYTEILEAPGEYIDALFLAIDRIGTRPREGDERLDELLWPAMHGLLDLLNATGREPVRKKGLKMLEARSAFMKRIQADGLDERREAQLMTRLRDWKASDKLLFPIMEAMEEIGYSSVVVSVREKRKAAVAKIFKTDVALDDVLAGPIIMTRHTFQKLAAELKQIDLELKTSIPQIIRKAREHGDLKENAEYEAAKLKQRQFSQRLTELDARIANVRILEDMAFEPDKVFPGTEVVVRDAADGVESTYWVLGDGDAEFGANVISYRAPLGKALVNRKVGDTMDYAMGDDTPKKLTIVRITPKRPGADGYSSEA